MFGSFVDLQYVPGYPKLLTGVKIGEHLDVPSNAWRHGGRGTYNCYIPATLMLSLMDENGTIDKFDIIEDARRANGIKRLDTRSVPSFVASLEKKLREINIIEYTEYGYNKYGLTSPYILRI